MASGREYRATMDNVAVTAAITLVQLATPATTGAEILRASVTQSSTTTNAQQRVQLVRKSGAATVTSFTALALNEKDPATLCVGGAALTGTNASAEGTDSNIVHSEVFSLLTGWLYVPMPWETITVAPSSFLGLKLPTAPGSSTTFTAELKFRETS